MVGSLSRASESQPVQLRTVHFTLDRRCARAGVAFSSRSRFTEFLTVRARKHYFLAGFMPLQEQPGDVQAPFA